MSKTLLVLAHTDYDNSFANKEIVGQLMKLVPNIELVHIDKEYPDLKIDID